MDPRTASIATDVARYWERRRLIYNALLASIVIGYFAAGLPRTTEVLTADGLSALFVLSMIANVLFCAAYIPDLFLQHTELADSWKARRWILFALGCALAGTMARFIAMDIFRERV